MSLGKGARLGVYEIVGAIGAGGMGEVYRARDTKLGREVALKVLPEALANDPERMRRFEREAKVLASLNHPNIATIYGFEDSAGVHALAMELVEGQTLDERIGEAGTRDAGARDAGPKAGATQAGAKGPIPLDEALPIAKQICEALEYAHERGIVHRDLKPANVKITPDSVVKILDFGLAKALEGETASADPSTSPTLSHLATQAGIILGTAAYMSPEQARGKAVDRRADIWAFGCVLYEMLTGKRAFGGNEMSETLAAVIRDTPDWSCLPSTVSPRIRDLLRRCLTKDAKQRLQAIGDARITIEEAGTGTAQGWGSAAAPAIVSAPKSGWRSQLPWLLAGLLAAGLVTVVVFWGLAAGPTRKSPVLAYLPPPYNTTFRDFGLGAGPVVVSPDGKRLAFSATGQNGVTKLYVRSLSSDKTQAIAGTEDAAGPFWSPDGHSLGFFADQKLKTVNLVNGNVQVLADASCERADGAWSGTGTILYTPRCNAPLDEISSSGGNPKPATRLGNGTLGQWAPAFLPDGRHFLFEAVSENGSSAIWMGSPSSIWMGSLGSSKQKLILKDASLPGYSSGDLLFVRDHHVFARAMDPASGKLAGEDTDLADAGDFSVSQGAVLAYQGGTREGRLEWYDRRGNPLGTVGPVARYIAVRISPDGKYVLADEYDPQSHSTDLWSYPASGGVGTRLTFSRGYKYFGAWSPYGKYIVYSCESHGRWGICRKPSNGSGAEQTLFTLGAGMSGNAIDWSPDGRYISVDERIEKGMRYKNVIFPVVGDEKPFRATPISANQYDGLFSPDGHWLAYFSYESGQPEVYVVPFPGPGGKFQISQNGGWTCKWDKEGHLYFLTMGDRLVEADLKFNEGAVRVNALHPLFQVSLPSIADPFFDVSADGSRLIVVTSTDPNTVNSITLLLHWQTKLKGKE